MLPTSDLTPPAYCRDSALLFSFFRSFSALWNVPAILISRTSEYIHRTFGPLVERVSTIYSPSCSRVAGVSYRPTHQPT